MEHNVHTVFLVKAAYHVTVGATFLESHSLPDSRVVNTERCRMVLLGHVQKHEAPVLDWCLPENYPHSTNLLTPVTTEAEC